MLGPSMHSIHKSRPGFTLVEILIVVVILGILATLVVPAFVGASQPARENVLRENLRIMRTQIELFTGQHRGTAPGYPNGDTSATPTSAAFVAHMTQYTSDGCDVADSYSASTPIKPYLTHMPSNPFTNLNAVRVLGSSEAIPAADGLTYGWFYKPAIRKFIANVPGSDETGRAYTDY